MARDAWDPARYDRFRRERREPFFDLLALVRRRPGMRVADLGCGTGDLTRLLHRELQAAATTGVDTSAAMLAESGRFASPGLAFAQADLRDWTPPAPLDLVFSNAALQWVPNHEALLERLTGLLAPGGQLAVQVPANYDHPSHTLAAEIAREAPFREVLEGWTHPAKPVLDPEEYAALLDRLGCRTQHVRLQVYGHHLAETADAARWTQGTLLTAYERRLPAAVYARFFERYREALVAHLGSGGPYFFSFKRILMWGIR